MRSSAGGNPDAIWRAGRGLFGNHGGHGGEVGFLVKGAAAGNHFVKHAAEGKDIGAPIDILARGLFGRHVGDGAQDMAHIGEGLGGTGFGIAGNIDFGDSEIEDLDQAAFGHHDVAGLEIAMYDAGGVRGGDGIGDLYGDGQQLAQGHTAGLEACRLRRVPWR